MADSYPSIGLHFDLNEVVAGQRVITETEESYLRLGRAAASAGEAATNAGKKIAESGAAVATSAGQRVTAAKGAAAAEEESLESSLAAVRRVISAQAPLWRQRATMQAAAAEEGAASERTFMEAQMDNARRIITAQSGLWRQRSKEVIAADREVQDYEAQTARESVATAEAAARARAAAEVRATQEDRAAYEAWWSIKMQKIEEISAFEAEQARVAATAAEEAARARAAAEVRATEEDRASYTAWWQAKAAMIEREAAVAAEAAAAEAEARELAGRAAMVDAEAMVKLTQAQLDQIRAEKVTIDSLAAERVALDALAMALERVAALKSANAAQAAYAIGANPAAASSAAMLPYQNALSGQTGIFNDRSSQIGFMEKTAAVMGLQGAYKALMATGEGLVGFFGRLGDMIRSVRLSILDARFAIAVMIGVMVAEPIIHMADAMTALEARTSLYVQSANQVPYVMEAIYQTAQKTRAPLDDMGKLITRLMPMMEKFGAGNADALRAAQTIGEALAIQGATPQETQATITQLTQALAGPRLYGQELRSLEHEAPTLLTAISKAAGEMGQTVHGTTSEFITLARQGKVSSEMLYEDITRAAAGIDAAFGKMPTTVQQGLNQVGNAFTHLIGEVNKSTGFSQGIASMLGNLTHFLDSAQTIDTISGLVRGMGEAFETAGHMVGTLIDNLPVILGLLGGLGIALAAAPLAAWIAGIVEAISSISLFGVAMGLGTAAVQGFAAVLAATPFALVAAAGATLGLIVKAAHDVEGATRTMSEAQQSTGSVISQVSDEISKYGGNTSALTAQLNSLTGATNDNTTAAGGNAAAQSEVQKAAQARLNLEVSHLEVLLRNTIAEDEAKAKTYDLSIAIYDLNTALSHGLNAWDNFAAGILRAASVIPGVAGIFKGSILALEYDRAQNNASAMESSGDASQLRQLQTSLRADADAARKALADLQRQRAAGLFVAKPPTSGTGTPESVPDPNKNKGAEAAAKALDTMRAELTSLYSQFQAVVNFDMSPLADDAAKITEAYDKAYAKFTDTKNAIERGAAAEYAGMAADKERMTILVQLGDQLLKQARAETERVAGIQASMAAVQAEHAAMDAFYASGSQNAGDFAKALRVQEQAQINAEKTQNELNITQRYGVTSVQDIASAYIASLGPHIAVTDKIREQAAQLQNAAQKTLDAKNKTVDYTHSLKDLQDVANNHTSALAQVAQLTAEAAAYREGEAAVTAYIAKQKELDAIRANHGQSAAEAVQDARDVAAAAANDNQAKLNAEMEHTVALATMTTQQREQEKEVLQTTRDLLAENRTLTYDQAHAMAEVVVQARNAQTQIAQMKVGLQDSIRDAFINTGNIFDAFKTGMQHAINQAIYDSLLAKPINMIVNATVNQLFGSSGSGGFLSSLLGGGSGSGGFLSSLFGQSTVTNTATQSVSSALTGGLGGLNTATTGIGTALQGGMSSISGALGSISAVLAPIGAAFAAGTIANGLGGMLGIDQNKEAKIGGYVGGLLGNLIGSIIGSHNTAYGQSDFAIQNGQLVNTTTHGYNGVDEAKLGQAAAGIATAFNQYASALGIDLSKISNFTATFGTTNRDKGSLTPGYFGGTFNGPGGGYEFAYKSGVGVQGVEDPVKAAKMIEVQMLEAAAAAAGQPLTDAAKALLDSSDNLDEAIKTIQQAAQLPKDIHQALLQFTDPRAAAMAQLQAQQVARREQLNALAAQGLIPADVLAKAKSELSQLEKLEISDVLGRFADSLNGAAHSLADFRAAQQKILDFVHGLDTNSQLSPLSPGQQMNQMRIQFFQMLQKARGGDYDSLSGISGLAQQYLQAAHQFYGSSPAYQQIYDQVKTMLEALGTADIQDPNQAALEAALKALQDAVLAGSQSIVDAINGTGGTGTGGDTTGLGGGGGGSGGGMDSAAMERLTSAVNNNTREVKGALARQTDALARTQIGTSSDIRDSILAAPNLNNAVRGGMARQA